MGHGPSRVSAPPSTFLTRQLAKLAERAELAAQYERQNPSRLDSAAQARALRRHPPQSYAAPGPDFYLSAPARKHPLDGPCGAGAGWSHNKSKPHAFMREPDVDGFQARVQRVLDSPDYAKPGQVGTERLTPEMIKARALAAQRAREDEQAERDLRALLLEVEREHRPARMVRRKARFQALT